VESKIDGKSIRVAADLRIQPFGRHRVDQREIHGEYRPRTRMILPSIDWLGCLHRSPEIEVSSAA
jgi:hypothetical protein